MSKITKRNIVDILIAAFTLFPIAFFGAGWWALLAIPFGLWNYYDGATRQYLRD